jgi:hypothetical protein
VPQATTVVELVAFMHEYLLAVAEAEYQAP